MSASSAAAASSAALSITALPISTLPGEPYEMILIESRPDNPCRAFTICLNPSSSGSIETTRISAGNWLRSDAGLPTLLSTKTIDSGIGEHDQIIEAFLGRLDMRQGKQNAKKSPKKMSASRALLPSTTHRFNYCAKQAINLPPPMNTVPQACFLR